MRKIILGLTILFTVISCTTENSEEKPVEAGLEASVKVLFTTNSLTGKNVQRGLIPITVDKLNIHTRKQGEQLFIDYPFTLVDNGTVGADTEFELRNLQMGTVDFQVFTNGGFGSGTGFGVGDGNYNYGERMVAAENGSLQTTFDKYNKKKPGIVFKASGVKEMIAGINEPIAFNLVPANGRIISIYTLSQELKDKNYTAKIEAIWSGSAILNKDNCVVRYEGTKACYLGNGGIADETVTIFDETGQTVAVFVVKPVIVNGESTNTIFTVTEDKIPAANKIAPTIFVPDFKSDLPSNIGV